MASGSFPAWVLLPVVALLSSVLYYQLGAAPDVLISRQLQTLENSDDPAQTAALIAGSPARDVDTQLHAGVAAGWLDAADAQALRDAAQLLWKLQAAVRLLTGGGLDPNDLGEGARRMILRETDTQGLDALLAQMTRLHKAADVIITRRLEGTG